ncbi:MAG: exo-alpha-sialidase [Clostridia bacterium]|nr:exo-alpha-sialidase [Clostridia bacterium]
MTVTRLIDLPAAPGNPRNSEGSFLKLKDDRIAFLYSRYSGTSSDDHAYAEVAVIFYDGTAWTEPRILLRPEPGTDETNYMSVSTARMHNGDAAVIYLVKHRSISSEVLLRRSSDEFETLGEPVRCVSPNYPGYYVVNNDRMASLSDGRWMIPAAIHPSSMGYHGIEDVVDYRSKCAFYASSDDGRTWRQVSDSVGLPGGAHSHSGLQEPGVTELSGGTLYAYFRTDLGRHYESFSVDGGVSWTAPQPSGFTGPCSPLLIKKNEFSGKYVAVWNPIPEVPFRWLHSEKPKIGTGGRTPLVIACSDDGVRFGKPELIETDPEGGFCYPAILFLSESEMLLAYCAGSGATGDENCLTRTRIVKITL